MISFRNFVFCAAGVLVSSIAHAQHPVNSVYQDGVAPSKGAVRSYEQTRNRVRVSGASEVQSGNFSAAFGLDLGGVPFDRDTTDTTSSHNGTSVLVDNVGTRFKRAFATLYGGINPRGVYAGGTTYAENDSVSYQGSSYVSMVNSNTGNTPSSSPSHWQVLSEAGVNTPIDWQGTYNNATAYVIGDDVDYQGSSYVAIANTIGNLPTNASFWQILAEKGATGATGAAGADGADGTDPGILFNFDTATADADPGAGNLRANNAALGSATQLFVSEDSRGGSDVEAFLLALDDSTNTIKGTLVLTDTTAGTQATYDVTGITNATDYVKIAVSGHAGATSLTNGNPISFQFTRSGDKGADGAGTVAGVAAGTGIDVNNSDPANPSVSVEANLAALNGLAVTDGNFAVGNGSTWVAESGSTARTSLGVAIGSDVQAFDTFLDDIAALTDPNADRIPFWDDSAGEIVWLTPSTGLTISGTDITVRSATDAQTGIVELATNAEAVTGTDTARAVTPAGVAAAIAAGGGGLSYLIGSATYDPPTIAIGATAVTNVTVTGAAAGDFALASFPQNVNEVVISAVVTGSNTVQVKLSSVGASVGAGGLTSDTLRVVVFPKSQFGL